MEEKALNDAIFNSKSKKIKIYPCHNLRASSIGHPCKRYLYYSIKNWDCQEPISETTQSIFDLGNSIEDYTIKTLRETEINGKLLEVITPTERSWKIDIPYISGREDCRIKEEDGQFYPVEIKGLSPIEWNRLNRVEDFYQSKKHYIQAYPAQLTCYMWKFEKDHGWFALTNKLTGQVKLIKVPFDWEFADKLLEKGKEIYKSIEEEKVPEPIDNENICESCSFKGVCGHINRVPLDVEVDDTLEELIDKKNELKEFKKEYDNLDEEIKQIINKRPKVLAGKYLCVYTKTIKPAHTEPAKEVPEKEIWRLSIKEIGGEKKH